MSEQINPVREGFEKVTPYLVIDGVREALEYYKKAFDAELTMEMPAPDGQRMMHGEITLMGSNFFLADPFPEMGGAGAPGEEQPPVSMHMYVADVDAVYKRAIEAGATPIWEPTDMFWGDRFGKLRDPFGHVWTFASKIGNPTPEEMAAAMAQMGEGGHE
jgi:uncharacterized glyoxalase superfamily protein PhnB